MSLKEEQMNKSTEAKKIKIEDIKFELSDTELERYIETKRENNIIGQKRAIDAIKMGIDIEEDGYNLFVMGDSGTGRQSAIFSLLSNFKPKEEVLQDMAYAFNFTTPSQPALLYLPRERGMEFKTELQKTIKTIRKKIRRMVKTGNLFHENNKIKEITEVEEVSSIAKFELMLKENGFEAIEKKRRQ